MGRYRFWVGVSISALFMYVALRGLQLELVWRTVRQANYWWLLPGVGAYFLGVWVRAWRWHYMLRPLKPIPSRVLFPVVAIGYMGNNIYPARAGELLRAYVLRRKAQVSVSASMATIVVERLFDGLTMLAFVVVALPTSPVGRRYNTVVIGFSALFLGVLVLFLWMAAHPHVARRWFERVVARSVPGRWHAQAGEVFGRFLEGLESLKSGRDVLLIFFTSVLIWLLETAKYWFVMHAFPFKVGFFVLILMNGVVNLATTLPAAPGYVGTFDAPGIEILEGFGVPGEVATGYTLVLHAALWLPITVLGLYYFWREQLSVARVRRELASAPSVDAEEEPTLFGHAVNPHVREGEP
ncbi:MAG: lysylphosphatidylglycerol synthase transmembrane domain-containing protein [Ardenticatenia bacterium]|nr:lysylphosphatidylglycerol synthase transmembrane domain-containing protein [Ardenticatenia bacterium]